MISFVAKGKPSQRAPCALPKLQSIRRSRETSKLRRIVDGSSLRGPSRTPRASRGNHPKTATLLDVPR